jgi:hypothetical protein
MLHFIELYFLVCDIEQEICYINKNRATDRYRFVIIIWLLTIFAYCIRE